MHRILFHIPVPFGDGSIPIYSYGFMMAVAFGLAIFISCRRGEKRGVPSQVVLDLGLYSVVAGIVGARLAFLMVDYIPNAASEHPFLDLVAIWKGGLTFQGGLLMALGVCVWYLKSRKLPAGKIADVFAPGLALGVAIGRIGCFLNGCCWGKVCAHDFSMGVRFPEESSVYWQHLEMLHSGSLQELAAGLGYPSPLSESALPLLVHPAQLYTSVGMLGIFVLLLLIDRLPRLFDGMLITLFIFFYSVFRFFIEFVRDDTPLHLAFASFPGLRLGQIIAIATGLVSVAYFLYAWRRESMNK